MSEIRAAIHGDFPWFKHYEPQVMRHIGDFQRPVSALLESSAERFPGHVVTRYFGGKITFRQMDHMANRFAGALSGSGFKPGDRVALMLPNCPQMVASYYGTLKARGVVVQINPLLSAPEVAFQLCDSGARILVALPRFENIFGSLLKDGRLEQVILAGVGDYAGFPYKYLIPLAGKFHHEKLGPQNGAGRIQFRDFVAKGTEARPIPAPLARDLALIQYTSGTTGKSKGAMLTHSNIVANALQCHAWLHDIKPGPGGDSFLAVIPFFHVYGMTVCMNLAIEAGCTLVLLPRFNVDSVLSAIRRYRCTIFPGVEIMYNALNHSPKSAKGYLKSIRSCLSGAGPLYREVQEKFEALSGGKVSEGYGLTEASPVTHCNPLFGERRTGSIGLPFPDTEAKVVDHSRGECELPAGEAGELLIRGPQVMQGYWNRPEETAKTLRNGWLHTGDIARMDKDGFFYIVDRKKDMIKTRGENVFPRSLEEVLMRHKGVADVVVVGIPDEGLGEKIKAYIVPGEVKPSPEELVEYCRKYLAKFEIPQEFEFRDSLPKNIIGKTLRRILRDEELSRLKGGKSS